MATWGTPTITTTITAGRYQPRHARPARWRRARRAAVTGYALAVVAVAWIGAHPGHLGRLA